MFNFTTQTVYNYIDATEGSSKRNLWTSSTGKPSLRIGNTRFDAADIESLQVKDPSIESLAEVTFDMSKILIPQDSTVNEITARIVLYIGLSMNSQDSFYANNLVYKGKPFFVEFPVKKDDTANIVAKRVKDIAKKYMLFVAEEKLLDVDIVATPADSENQVAAVGTVTFKGVNGYQQIKKAMLQKFDPEAKTLDCCTHQGEYVDVVVGVPVIYTIGNDGLATAGDPAQKLGENGAERLNTDNETPILPGLEAFGDYNWIIHNLRLPTAANYYPWSPTNRAGENPIPGQQYTQFIVRIKKERDGIMGEIAGARGTSVSTHVLYVAGDKDTSNTPANKVYKAFTDTVQNGGLNITAGTVADTKLAAPYA